MTMRKILMAVLLCLAGMTTMAQPGQGSRTPGYVPPPTRYTVRFESQHGEAFSVFVDGDLVNRMPQSRVMVNDVSDQTHEVVVVLRRPAEKAAVMSLRPGEPNVVVNVNYDQRLEQLLLYTPSHNRAESYVADRRPVYRDDNVTVIVPPSKPLPPPHNEVRGVSDEDVAAMVVRMKGQTFDSDRLALGKVLVASSELTAAQIGRLAETIDFSNSQVEFLKYAYNYCIDPVNYYLTTDALTFSSDKKKVLDYIATQR